MRPDVLPTAWLFFFRGFRGSSDIRHLHCSQLRNAPGDFDALCDAAGSGMGKHGRALKRSRKNKYQKDSKAAAMDPLEAQIAVSKAFEVEKENTKRKHSWNLEDELEVEKDSSTPDGVRERGVRIYPDETSIDPYDPSTFGFVHIGTVLGAHGLQGEIKVRTASDFAEDRLGLRAVGRPVYLKAPDRRFPKRHIISSGRPMGQGRKPDGNIDTNATVESRVGVIADMYLVRLKDVRLREDAARLRNYELYVWQTERQQTLKSDEYLVEDLVGLKCILNASGAVVAEPDTFFDFSKLFHIGEVIGVVTRDEVCSTTDGHDLLEIQIPERKWYSYIGQERDQNFDKGKEGCEVGFVQPNTGDKHRNAKSKIVLIPLVPQIVPVIDTEAGFLVMDPPPGLLELTAPEKKTKTRIRGLLPEKAEVLEQRRQQKRARDPDVKNIATC